jgi:hypothetical protein
MGDAVGNSIELLQVEGEASKLAREQASERQCRGSEVSDNAMEGDSDTRYQRSPRRGEWGWSGVCGGDGWNWWKRQQKKPCGRCCLLSLASAQEARPPARPEAPKLKSASLPGDDVGIIHSQPYDHCKTLPSHRHCPD